MCACGPARNLADPISNFPRQAPQDPRCETAENRGGHGVGRRPFDPAIRAVPASVTPRAFRIRQPPSTMARAISATARPWYFGQTSSPGLQSEDAAFAERRCRIRPSAKVRITAFVSGVKPTRQVISCGIGDDMDDARPLTGSGNSTKSLCAVLVSWIGLPGDCIPLMADFGDGSRLEYCL